MRPTLISLALLLLTTFTNGGCGHSPNAPADTASVELGGISIEVIKPGSNSIDAGAISRGPEKNSVTLGTVEIEIGAAQNGQRTLTINGKQYGSATNGDKVVISEARDVTVNGTSRHETTEERPAEEATTVE